MKKYGLLLFLGTIFGIALAKAEIISWFRIQEMFRFQAFHMYGVIGSHSFTRRHSGDLLLRCISQDAPPLIRGAFY